MTQFYRANVSNQMGIFKLKQYNIIRMLYKCLWVARCLQKGRGNVQDTDPLAIDHCSCVAMNPSIG